MVSAFSQVTTTPKAEQPKPTAKPTATPDQKLVAAKPVTADQVVEAAIIFAYAYPGGRPTLNQIRKTTLERGRATYTAADGKIDQATYQRFVIRAETLDKEKIRLDQEFPNARYSLVFAEEKIYGIFNNSVFTPRDDAAKGFENQIIHGIESLLRYKEDQASPMKLSLAMPVEYSTKGVILRSPAECARTTQGRCSRQIHFHHSIGRFYGRRLICGQVIRHRQSK